MKERVTVHKEEIHVDLIGGMMFDDVVLDGDSWQCGEFVEFPAYHFSTDHGYLRSIDGLGTRDVIDCGGAVDEKVVFGVYFKISG